MAAVLLLYNHKRHLVHDSEVPELLVLYLTYDGSDHMIISHGINQHEDQNQYFQYLCEFPTSFTVQEQGQHEKGSHECRLPDSHHSLHGKTDNGYPDPAASTK